MPNAYEAAQIAKKATHTREDFEKGKEYLDRYFRGKTLYEDHPLLAVYSALELAIDGGINLSKEEIYKLASGAAKSSIDAHKEFFISSFAKRFTGSFYAGVAQRIEHMPSKHVVAGSSPASRSITPPTGGAE